MKLVLISLSILLLTTVQSAAQTYEVVNQMAHDQKYNQYPRVLGLEFSKDSRYLVTAGNEGKSILWDVASGRIIRTYGNEFKTIDDIQLSDDLQTLAVFPSYDAVPKLYDVLTGNIISQMPYDKSKLTGNNSLIRYYKEENQVLLINNKSAFIRDATTWEVLNKADMGKSYKVRLYKSDITQKGDRIALGWGDGSVTILSYPELEVIKKIPSIGSWVYNLKFSGDGNTLVVIGRGSSVKIRVYDVANGYKKINELVIEKKTGTGWTHPPVGGLVVNHDGTQMVITRNHYRNYPRYKLMLVDLKTMALIHSFDDQVIYSHAIAISPDGQYLAVGRNNPTAQVSLYDWESGNKIRDFKVTSVPTKPSLILTDKRVIVNAYDQYNSFELITGEKVSGGLKYGDDGKTTEELAEAEEIPNFFLKMDYERPLWGYRSAFGEAYSPSKKFAIQLGSINEDGKYMDNGKQEKYSRKEVVSIVNCQTNEQLPLIDANPQHNSSNDIPAITDDGKYFFDSGRVYDIENNAFLLDLDTLLLNDLVMNAIFLHDNKTLMVATINNHLIGYDVEKGVQSMTFDLDIDIVVDMKVSTDDKEIFLAKMDASVLRVSLTKQKLIATYYTFDGENYATVLPNGYYRKSPGSYDLMHFVSGMKVVGFEIFDLVFNRPDKVMEYFGFSDQNVLNNYYKAYAKRVKSLDFELDQISTEVNLPAVSIGDYSPPVKTPETSITVPISIDGKGSYLDRLNVYVNNVPIYGKLGKKLQAGLKNHAEDIAIPLGNGNNKIEISVHNTAGYESPRVLLTVACETFVQPNLYIISFGVSEFQDSDYNLTYAAKDARDIINTFSQHDGTYGEVFVTELTNQNATTQNIKLAKVGLMKSKVNDFVIVFVASHGLVSDDFSYYLATNDIDFYHPEGKGLKYEDLESLLDGIPARNKVMFLDACHSGELDADDLEIQASEATASLNTSVSSRGFKVITKKASSSGSSALTSSFDLMKELFADIRRGTGAVVISAASGQEYAYESDAWRNGVFTYSLLEGLRNNKADANNDLVITVTEIKTYLSNRVQELTNGKQHPTSRTENLENDFTVWE